MIYRYTVNKNNDVIGLNDKCKSRHYIDSSFYICDFIHPCGLFRYAVDAENEIILKDLTQELKFKSWEYEKIIYPIVQTDFFNSYGSYGRLGCLVSDAKSRLHSLDGINVFIDEMRTPINNIDADFSTNIRYSGDPLDKSGEQGFWYVVDPEQDAVILTQSLDCQYDVFYVCLVGVIFEYGYQIQDILLEYRKGNGAWTIAYSEGKKPYSVYSKIEVEGNSDIQLRLTLKTGNNDLYLHAFLVSFALVGK